MASPAKPASTMKPMHIPGVEQNPKPSSYADLIRGAQEAGGEYWKIWHLFAFQPEMTAHLASFSHSVMHEPAPIEPKLRELIAAYTSHLNDCAFCMKSHRAIAAELYGDEALVRAVLTDLETSPLSEKDKALLRFVEKNHAASAHRHRCRFAKTARHRLDR